jgi:hypothetical protein
MTQLADLKVGDIIDGFISNPDTLVTAVEYAEPVAGVPMIRYRGRLGRRMAFRVQGDPRKQEWKKAELAWCFPASSEVELIQPGFVRV